MSSIILDVQPLGWPIHSFTVIDFSSLVGAVNQRDSGLKEPKIRLRRGHARRSRGQYSSWANQNASKQASLQSVMRLDSDGVMQQICAEVVLIELLPELEVGGQRDAMNNRIAVDAVVMAKCQLICSVSS